LEKVFGKHPHDYDTLKLLFRLYSIQKNSEKVLIPLESISKMAKRKEKSDKNANVAEVLVVKDSELLSDIAEYLERTNVYAARKRRFIC
jgi:hypothetical protein